MALGRLMRMHRDGAATVYSFRDACFLPHSR